MDYEAITPRRVKSLEKKVKELESRALQVIGGLKNDPIPSKVDDITLPLHVSNKKIVYNKVPEYANEIVNKNYVDANIGSGGGAIDVSGTPSTNQYARWTDADTLEGRSTSDVLSDIGASTVSALNDLSDVTYSSGDLTISSLDKIVTSGSLEIDSGSNIELNADGGFVNMKDGSASMVTATRPDSVTGELQIYPNNFGDISKITATTHGATTISTTDVDGTSGHLTLDVNGDIILDSDTGNFIAKKGGTEFSAANSAYAGMILGYTYIQPSTTVLSFEIQNALTVENDGHKISFKTPPSENVEIEVTAMINCSSSDTRISVGLSSTNATDGYTQVAGHLEYDSSGIFFTDDEVDDHVKTFKFVVEAANLAAIGSDNTFWIGFSTSNSTKTAYLTYGYRSTHNIANHPFIIKATALPETLYDGT